MEWPIASPCAFGTGRLALLAAVFDTVAAFLDVAVRGAAVARLRVAVLAGLAELEHAVAAGCRIVKIHTAIQGVDPSRPDFDPFYALARELRVVLMFHTGYEQR